MQFKLWLEEEVIGLNKDQELQLRAAMKVIYEALTKAAHAYFNQPKNNDKYNLFISELKKVWPGKTGWRGSFYLPENLPLPKKGGGWFAAQSLTKKPIYFLTNCDDDESGFVLAFRGFFDNKTYVGSTNFCIKNLLDSDSEESFKNSLADLMSTVAHELMHWTDELKPNVMKIKSGDNTQKDVYTFNSYLSKEHEIHAYSYQMAKIYVGHFPGENFDRFKLKKLLADYLNDNDPRMRLFVSYDDINFVGKVAREANADYNEVKSAFEKVYTEAIKSVDYYVRLLNDKQSDYTPRRL